MRTKKELTEDAEGLIEQASEYPEEDNEEAIWELFKLYTEGWHETDRARLKNILGL